MAIGEFHARSGFYFKRLANGRVRIRVTTEPLVDSPTHREIEISDSEWASIVATVSGSGENVTTWKAALDFHNAEVG